MVLQGDEFGMFFFFFALGLFGHIT